VAVIVALDEDDYAEVACDIGSDDPEDVAEALALLWTELGNPTEMIQDVKPEVRVK